MSEMSISWTSVPKRRPSFSIKYSIFSRWSFGLQPANAVGVHVADPVGPGSSHRSNFASLDQSGEFLVNGRATAIQTNGDDPVSIGRGRYHLSAFVKGGSQWFFNIDVLACIGSSNSGVSMPVIRHNDQDSINIFAGQQFPEITIGLTCFIAFFIQFRRIDTVHKPLGILQTVPIHITHSSVACLFIMTSP